MRSVDGIMACVTNMTDSDWARIKSNSSGEIRVEAGGFFGENFPQVVARVRVPYFEGDAIGPWILMRTRPSDSRTVSAAIEGYAALCNASVNTYQLAEKN